MDNDNSLSKLLSMGNPKSEEQFQALGDTSHLSQQNDDQSLVVAQLQNEANNIRETQQQYGMPAIGDLFKSRPQDVQETINSVFYMLKQRIQDIEMRNDFRQKTQRIEQQRQDADTQLGRAKEKNEQAAKEVTNLKDKMKSQEAKHK